MAFVWGGDGIKPPLGEGGSKGTHGRAGAAAGGVILLEVHLREVELDLLVLAGLQGHVAVERGAVALRAARAAARVGLAVHALVSGVAAARGEVAALRVVVDHAVRVGDDGWRAADALVVEDLDEVPVRVEPGVGRALRGASWQGQLRVS